MAPGVKNPAPVATGPASNSPFSVKVGETGTSRGGKISSMSSGAVPSLLMIKLTAKSRNEGYEPREHNPSNASHRKGCNDSACR